MLKVLLSTAALSIALTSGAFAQTDGTSTDPTDNMNSASETTPAGEMSTEGWSQPMLDTFFVSSELSTLRSAEEISTSFAALTQAEQEQVRSGCAGIGASGTAGGSTFGTDSDATAGQGATGSSASDTAAAPDNAAGGANDAAISGEGTPETVPSESGSSMMAATATNWTELCATIGAM